MLFTYIYRSQQAPTHASGSYLCLPSGSDLSLFSGLPPSQFICSLLLWWLPPLGSHLSVALLILLTDPLIRSQLNYTVGNLSDWLLSQLLPQHTLLHSPCQDCFHFPLLPVPVQFIIAVSISSTGHRVSRVLYFHGCE